MELGFGSSVRTGRLEGIGGVFREPGDLLGQLGDLLGESVDLRQQLGVLPAQSSVFCFQFRDASQIGLFSGRFHRPLPVVLLVVSSAMCGVGLSKAGVLGRRHGGCLGINGTHALTCCRRACYPAQKNAAGPKGPERLQKKKFLNPRNLRLLI